MPKIAKKQIKPMVLNLRGCMGAGKSYIVHQLLKKYSHTIEQTGKDIRGYILRDDRLHNTIAVIGRYDRTCGGCDSIKEQDDICDRIRQAHADGYSVLFEGMMIGHIFKRYSELADELGHRNDFIFAYLDTPKDLCVQRVFDRRAARGAKKEFDPHNVIKEYADQTRTRGRFLNEKGGYRVVDIDHTRPVEHLEEFLIQGSAHPLNQYVS